MNKYIAQVTYNQTKQDLVISSVFTIGTQGCDLNIENENFQNIQAKIRLNNDFLTLTFLGLDSVAHINKQKLDHGKMYILEIGDKVKFDNLLIEIKLTNIENEIEEDLDLDLDLDIEETESNDLSISLDLEKENKVSVSEDNSEINLDFDTEPDSLSLKDESNDLDLDLDLEIDETDLNLNEDLIEENKLDLNNINDDGDEDEEDDQPIIISTTVENDPNEDKTDHGYLSLDDSEPQTKTDVITEEKAIKSAIKQTSSKIQELKNNNNSDDEREDDKTDTDTDIKIPVSGRFKLNFKKFNIKGVFNKLKNNNKEKEKKVTQLKDKKAKKIKTPKKFGLTSSLDNAVPTRLLCFIFEFIFILFLYDFILQNMPEIYSFMNEIVDQVIKLTTLKNINNEIYLTLNFYLFYVITEILIHLILGMSIIQKFALFKSNDSFLSARIKGAIRSLISSLTFFLILPDLLLLFNKPSLKEIITRSKIGVKSKALSFIFTIFFIPILTILFIALPLILKVDTFTTNFKTQELKKKTLRSNMFMSEMNIEKNYFKSIKSSFKQNLPKDIKLLSGIYQKKPSLYITNEKEDIEIIVSPVLNKSYNTIIDDKVIKATPYYLINTLISEDHTKLEEIISALNLQLNLEKPNIYSDIFLRHGPFLSSLINLRERILKEINLSNIKYLHINNSILIFEKLAKQKMKFFILNKNEIISFNITFTKAEKHTQYLLIKLFGNKIKDQKKKHLVENENIKLLNILSRTNSDTVFDLNIIKNNPLITNISNKNKYFLKLKNQTYKILTQKNNSLLNEIGEIYKEDKDDNNKK